jgi:hypothetical protein
MPVQWLDNNKQWLFDGLGAGIVIAVLGFLASRIFKSSQDSEPTSQKTEVRNKNTNQIIIQLNAGEAKQEEIIHSAPGETPNEIVQVKTQAPVPLTKITRLTPKGIRQTIESGPLLMKKQIAEQYYGLTVEWLSELTSAKLENGNKVRLMLNILEDDKSSDYAACVVSLKNYNELKVMTKGAKIKVIGEIEEIDLLWFNLKNVRLYFE